MRLSEQVGMCSGTDESNAGWLNFINQQPIRLNVTFAVIDELSPHQFPLLDERGDNLF